VVLDKDGVGGSECGGVLLLMKRWVTEIKAIDPNAPDKGVILWFGPYVEANTLEEAEKYCQDNGLGYCKVIGKLIEEIPWSIAEHAVKLNSNRDN